MDTSKIRKELDNELKIFPYMGKYPKMGENVFLASGVKVIGDVTIGDNSSVWYNTVIRGDVHYIRIGSFTNIQDCSMLHVTNGKYPLNIGDKVTIGHSVKLHGCTLKDMCLIGIGSVVLDGSVVESESMVAAGSVIKPNFIVPSGKLVAGVPAKVVRDLSEEEIRDFERSAMRYKKYTEMTIESLKDI